MYIRIKTGRNPKHKLIQAVQNAQSFEELKEVLLKVIIPNEKKTMLNNSTEGVNDGRIQ